MQNCPTGWRLERLELRHRLKPADVKLKDYRSLELRIARYVRSCKTSENAFQSESELERPLER